MASQQQIDATDRELLAMLQQDARLPYLEIGRRLGLSGASIHQRVNRLRGLGVIRGSSVRLDRRRLGLDVMVVLGLHLRSAGDVDEVLAGLREFPEVIEAYYTTGNYSLMLKVVAPSIEAFHHFLRERLQSIDAIRATESFVCLDQPIDREVDVSRLPAG
jgi:Lrp/AsnC family transcriptional regulator for asnA, asnC and gidA